MCMSVLSSVDVLGFSWVFFPWSSLIFLFIFKVFKKPEKQDFFNQFLFPSLFFIFDYLCVLTSHHPSVFHFSALSPHWNSISTSFFICSLHSSISCWPADCTQPSCVLWLLPPSSVLLSPPPPLSSAALQKTIRKVRGVASHFSRDLLSASTSSPASPFPFSSSSCYRCPCLLPSSVFLPWSLPKHLSWSFSSCFPPVSCLCACQSRSLFNSPVPPCCPLRCFPNSWSRSGAAWLGPCLSSLRSHQERHWVSEFWLLSTTTTRRLNSCWSGGFIDCCAYFLNWIVNILLASFIVNFQSDGAGFLDFNLWTSLNVS